MGPRRSVSAVLLFVTAVCGTALLPADPAGAVATVTVNTTADGLPPAPRVTSLREAIDRAEAGTDATTIVLQPGATYQLTRCAGATEDVNDTGDLDVLGATGAVTIDGNGATIHQTCAGERVLDHFGTDLTLQELTLTGGDVDGDGGAVRSLGSLDLLQSTVEANRATGAGGGLHTQSVAIVDSVIEGNQAGGDGGGVFATQPGIPPAIISLTRSTVTANTAGGRGGGVSFGGLATLRRSAVVANTAARTGGAFLPLATVENTTIADNVEDGGASPDDAVEVESLVELTLRHATIRGGTGDGGALGAGTTFRWTASVVAAGQAGGACALGADEDGGGGANADDDGSCGLDEADDLPDADLGLTAALAANGGPTPNIRPAGSSPLVDGDDACAAALTVDQRGVGRPQAGACDIGAVESRRRPDALIRRSTVAAFTGNNLYDTLGATGQSVAATTGRGVAVELVIRLQNDGEVRERQTIQGPGSDTRFVVRYVRAGVDVTAAVVAGTQVTAALAPGASEDLWVRIVPRAGAPRAAVKTVLVRSRLVAAAGTTDAVKAVVTVG